MKDFAAHIKTSPAYLSQMLNGVRKVSKYMCLVIERLTNGQVPAAVLTPEINERHHYCLIDGVVSRAYQKNDVDTFDPNFYQLTLGKWKEYVEKIKQEVNRFRRSELSVVVHQGLL
ncbi:MAG: helix-turn-helix domain-containing protein [Nitrospirae bacterium]|nr:helix-turn-helix domain-containing protein [Nitrospirota bacterium]